MADEEKTTVSEPAAKPADPKPADQPTTAKPAAANPAPVATTSSGGKGGGAAVIIIIIILAIAVLGVGGYFGWKYLGKKISNKITGVTATSTATSTSGKISVQTVIDALMYPGAKISDQKQEKDSVYKAELTLASSDSVDTIKAYYLNLVSKNKWEITRQGSSSSNNYYMTIESTNFTAEIDITKYEGYDTTDIGIKISGDNLTTGGIAATSTATVSAKPTSSSTSTSGNYVISDSNTRIISRSELTGFTPWQLKVARNEIYARYGRPFVHKDLQCYFAKKSWYKEDPNATNPTLSSTESKNVATIQAYEQETNSSLANTDSGCDTNS